MMMNLFSSFDPCTGMMSLNWLSMMLMFIMLPYNMWLIPNNNLIMINNIINNIFIELKSNLKCLSSSILMMSIFLFIMMNNIMGLIPYIFTCSSHLLFSLTLSLPLWLSFILYNSLKKTNLFLSHMVPYGTPIILMPFMVLIETTSNLIRPGSLAVRLTANMIAGHILMSLLGNSSKIMISFMLLVFMLLMIFEMAVSIIQSYVFMTLTSLYSSE
uniref:ATP synthase F0 subunit 6 n=1 Tax=Krisna nigromarginata TaxID=1962557 RepID=UPI002552058F|nr:ATP synthase F0 subunit 6 [Krisna nigromarginata]WGG89437.1 ATP synthase F0 subunit 6 [Krisna nigromarginata]